MFQLGEFCTVKSYLNNVPRLKNLNNIVWREKPLHGGFETYILPIVTVPPRFRIRIPVDGAAARELCCSLATQTQGPGGPAGCQTAATR